MNLRAVDKSCLPDHFYIRSEDTCFYLHEYVSGAGYDGGIGNSLILNIKRKPSKMVMFDYRWRKKYDAIWQCTCDLKSAILQKKTWLEKVTFVPMPGSKAYGHVDYDDRMGMICKHIHTKLDVRSLIIQKRSVTAAHARQSNERPGIAEVRRNLEIDENYSRPLPKWIVVVDDVLTTGAHYRAVCDVLKDRFREAHVAGLFLARRVFRDNNAPKEQQSDDTLL